MALVFEFHTPFAMFGEPVSLVAMELGFRAVLAVEGVLLATIYGRSSLAGNGPRGVGASLIRADPSTPQHIGVPPRSPTGQ